MSVMPELTGSQIGRYSVLSVLGRGGMGIVYDAIDPSLGRHVALKVLPAELASDSHRLARFVREARAASALNHPSVVAIYEIGHERIGSNDVHFIAMEKVEGSSLRTLLTGNRLPIARVVDLVAQIADAIATAHAAGIVHRDLKPENVVLSAQGTPKVLDFGLAKLRPGEEGESLDSATALRSTDSGVILGTVGYMAPEQAQGKPADHRSDIFALGCILYEAVAGRRAFAGASAVETLHAIINVETPPLRHANPSASVELQRIASKSLAKNPDERYQSAKEMAIDLRAVLREGPAGGRASRRRPRTALIALLAVAAVIVVAGIALAVRSRRAPAAAAVSAPSLSMRRVTSRGTVTHAAISPDGRFVAYSLLDRSIRLRQLATGQEIELIPPGPTAVWGLTFTPDGESIVYVGRDQQTRLGACYRVAAIGGRPEHLVDGADSAPTVSPDGKQIAWARADFPKPGESSLMVANIDGSGARAIATRRAPEMFAPLLFYGPSWSPDGTAIAAVVQREADPIGAKLVLVDPKSGAERALHERSASLITQIAWVRDGSGIVITASSGDHDVTRMSLWFVPYPVGTPRRITAELGTYRGVSVAARQDTLVTLLVEISSQVWAVSLAPATSGEMISNGKTDGWRGLSWLPDGRIVFTNVEDEKQTLLVSNRDGSGRMRLTRDDYDNRFPAVFRTGIAYVSATPSRTDVCVTDFQGETRRVVAGDVDQSPIAVSSDGVWLAFRRNRRLWKMPMNGGPATELVREVSSAPAWSPAGDRIAVLLGDSDTYTGRVAVVSATDARLLWTSTPSSVHKGTTMRWLPDGSALIINAGPADDRNLWLFPMDGPPRRLTDFKDQRAYHWDLSPDGRTAVVARANISRDAVLISGFR